MNLLNINPKPIFNNTNDKIRRNLADIRLATKWLQTLSLPPNDKIRKHLVANLISVKFLSTFIFTCFLVYFHLFNERSNYTAD